MFFSFIKILLPLRSFLLFCLKHLSYVQVNDCNLGCMLKYFSFFIFLFLKGGSFTVVETVTVIFAYANFSRDIASLETEEKKSAVKLLNIL